MGAKVSTGCSKLAVPQLQQYSIGGVTVYFAMEQRYRFLLRRVRMVIHRVNTMQTFYDRPVKVNCSSTASSVF